MNEKMSTQQHVITNTSFSLWMCFKLVLLGIKDMTLKKKQANDIWFLLFIFLSLDFKPGKVTFLKREVNSCYIV